LAWRGVARDLGILIKMKALQNINDRIAVLVTGGVATMWCAYFFAILAIWGGTGVHWDKPFEVVQWISQTFLQLVLLSIIMVGQKVLSDTSDKQAKEMHDAVMEELNIAKAERAEFKKMHGDIKLIVETVCVENKSA
jgi:hypothetical protein